MWGLLKDESRIGARKRILGTIDALGGVDNVGLVFGEVDARFHSGKYFVGDRLSHGRLYELIGRFRRFIDEDLRWSGRVRNKVFVYHGYRYPRGAETPFNGGTAPMGDEVFRRAEIMHSALGPFLQSIVDQPYEGVHFISPWAGRPTEEQVSADGIHLVPELIYPTVLAGMKKAFNSPYGRATKELPL
jgi:hypothetical protein